MVLKISLSMAFVLILLITVYQDLKSRTIHVMLPVALFGICLVVNFKSSSIDLEDMLRNVMFIIVNLVGIFVYSGIKKRKFVNPVNDMIGAGDVLFFLAFTPALEFQDFMVFFIASMLFSLMLHGLVLLFRKVETIPLAGYMSLFILGMMVYVGINRIW